MDSDELAEIKERLVPFMVSECGRHGVTRVFFMLTNIIEESTELLYYGEGSEEMARIAFHMEPKEGVFDLKGVVSRKKQLFRHLWKLHRPGQNDTTEAADRIAEDNKKWKKKPGKQEICFIHFRQLW